MTRCGIFSHDRYALQIALLPAVVGWLMSYGVGVARYFIFDELDWLHWHVSMREPRFVSWRRERDRRCVASLHFDEYGPAI
ncbi:MAG: hypothetical protein VCB43_02195 [Myxococcota bacterium]